MAYTGGAEQLGHVAGVENVGDKAIALVEVEAVLKECGNTRCVLSAMLQHGQGVIEDLSYWLVSKDTDDATHLLCLPNLWSARLSLQIAPDSILRCLALSCRLAEHKRENAVVARCLLAAVYGKVA